MNISNWEFQSITNQLEVILQTKVQTQKGSECQVTSVNVDTSQNLRSIMISLRGVTLYQPSLLFPSLSLLPPFLPLSPFSLIN